MKIDEDLFRLGNLNTNPFLDVATNSNLNTLKGKVFFCIRLFDMYINKIDSYQNKIFELINLRQKNFDELFIQILILKSIIFKVYATFA